MGHQHENIHLFDRNTRKGLGTFFVPGCLLSVKPWGQHIYIMYAETESRMEYSPNNNARFKNASEGDCPLQLTEKEWLTKSNVSVVRLTPGDVTENWICLNALNREGFPPSLIFNTK